MQTVAPTSTLNLIGNTPLVPLQAFDSGRCSLFLKLESQNPGGSIKDRMAISMIEAAERTGQLHPGQTLVEATAGNTGIGLALVAAIKKYGLILVIPDKMSSEKVAHARALGADIRLTRSDVGPGHPEYYQDMAARIARETPDSYHINQFSNPANPEAHENTTGPEIWEQMDHHVDAVVCGVGSGGTLTGLSRYFARVQPALEMVLADPEGSSLYEFVTDRPPRAVRELCGGRYRRKLRACHRGSVARAHGLLNPRYRELSHRARVAQTHRHTGRFIDRHTAGCGLAILSGPNLTQAGGHLRLRHGREVPVEDVQRLLDARSGLRETPAHGRASRDLVTRRYDEGAVITVGPARYAV